MKSVVFVRDHRTGDGVSINKGDTAKLVKVNAASSTLHLNLDRPSQDKYFNLRTSVFVPNDAVNPLPDPPTSDDPPDPLASATDEQLRQELQRRREATVSLPVPTHSGVSSKSEDRYHEEYPAHPDENTKLWLAMRSRQGGIVRVYLTTAELRMLVQHMNKVASHYNLGIQWQEVRSS